MFVVLFDEMFEFHLLALVNYVMFFKWRLIQGIYSLVTFPFSTVDPAKVRKVRTIRVSRYLMIEF